MDGIANGWWRWLSPALLAAAPAAAQSPPSAATATPPGADAAVPGTTAAATAPAATPDGLDDILVTARRSQERLQSVPVAVSAFTPKALVARGIRDVRDLAQAVPNLQIYSSTSSATSAVINLRGQESSNISMAFDPTVGVYFDEVYLGRSTGGLLSTLQDMDSVEVLRGVQGTLFGRNNQGGAVVLRPARPNLTEVGGNLLAGYGNLDRVEVGGVVNLPVVTDRIGVRASIDYFRRDGFQRSTTTGIDDFGDRDRVSGRAAIRLAPAAGLFIDLTFDHSEIHETGPLNTLFTNPAFNVSQISVADPKSTGGVTGYTGHASYQLGDFEVKGIFGYRKVHSTDIFDVDGSTPTSLDYYLFKNQHQYSEELNVNGKLLKDATPWLRDVSVVAGLFNFRESGEELRQVPFFTTPATGTFQQQLFANRSKAAYFQLEAHLLDALAVFAGARYTDETRRAASGIIRANVCTTDRQPLADCYRRNRVGFDFWTYTAGARYEIPRFGQVYARVARGVRSGGLDNNTVAPFKPEILEEYEIGLKADLLDRHLRTNIALFHSDFTNIQRSSLILINGVLGLSTSNAASARINGVEAEVTLVPVRQLTLSGSLGYLDAKYRSYLLTNANGTVSDLSANKFPNAPKWTYALSADYTLPITAVGPLEFRTDFAWRGGTFFRVENLPQSFQKGYGLLNGRISLRPDFVHGLEIAAWGRNLTNRHYNTQGLDPGNGTFVLWRSSEPRTYGVELRQQF